MKVDEEDKEYENTLEADLDLLNNNNNQFQQEMVDEVRTKNGGKEFRTLNSAEAQDLVMEKHASVESNQSNL